MPQASLRCVALFLIAACSSQSSAPKPVPQAASRAELPNAAPDLTARFETGSPDLEVRLWAQSPDLYNPTAIDVDAKGRLWVTEAVNYRKWNGRNPGLAFPAGDRVVILADTDGDGACDSSKVFVQDTDLVAPLGVAVIGDRVIVSCSPSVIVYTDANGDDVPDKKEIFLTGFGGHDHDHGVHSCVAGPDGRWYLNTGNAGPHVVTDKSGRTLRSGSIYRDGGEHTSDNRPRMTSDDGRVWTGGLVLRVRPDGTRLTVLAHNFRNNYEVALDSFGNLYQSDNDDEIESCRTLWCMEGGNHGYFAADGSRTWQADRRPGQSTVAAHWHQGDPGVVPMGTITGSGGPTGACVIEGGALGKEWLGKVLLADAGRSIVFAQRPVPKGAGIELEPGFLLRARFGGADDDEAHEFRPSDVAIGTDGAVYVADWYDPGVGGHAMADQKGYGRILRVAPRGASNARPVYDLATDAGRLAALASPAVDVRDLGWRAFAAQGERALPALERAWTGSDPFVRARALWLIAQAGSAGRARAEAVLADADPRMRITAFRALRAAGADPLPYARTLAGDRDAGVRREAALALRDASFADAREPLEAIARAWDGSDRYALEALGIGASGKEEELLLWLGRRRDMDPAWQAKMLAFAWRLHPASALPLLVEWSARPDATAEQRALAVDGIAFVPGRASAEAMLAIALGGREELRAQAAWWVQFRDGNDWKAFALAAQLAPADRSHAKLAWSSGVMQKGIVEADVDIAGARTLWLVVTPAAGGIDYDWADWLAPKLVGPRGETSLAQTPWLAAKAGWGWVLVDKSCEGGPLKVGGKTFAEGIGTHAASEIVYRLPAGEFTRLVCTVAPDDGGAAAQGSRTDVEFQVWVDAPPDRSAFEAARKTLLDPGADEAARVAAAQSLAADREGAFALIHLAEQGKLPPAIRTAVGPALLAHADPAVRALAAPAFRAAESGSRAEPSLDELVALTGDRRRGAAVYFGKSATCSTCHAVRGRGGDVGPDLSAIRLKYGKRELFDHILHPNLAVEHGYQAWTIETADGRIYTGLVQAGVPAPDAQGVYPDDLVLKQTDGQRVVVAADEIEGATQQKLSLMPDNVAIGLAPQELADLVAFLAADPDAKPRLGETIALFNGRDMSGWTFHLDDPKATMADTWSVADGVLHCKGRPIGYIRTEKDYESYVLELDWRFVPGVPPGNSGVLMRMTGADKVWPKSIEAQLQHRNAGDFWNIDEFQMEADRSRTEGRHTEKEFPCNEKPIGEWNHYRITLNGGDLTLEVNGLVQNVAHWCEEIPGKLCLQSEGAEIEFRDIRLTPILK